ncbi:hypothetical protein N657DRAFT_281853 [Parathielavia appendiculata]|uniref:Uncharacterized protein n=1 Tax=Parathielavia appendiculata TaxID=2587402 RepID=A0AAN6U3R2_9PEZI|nr:hypothetical protein N657DRAFT_281853 [Parathielavia appendiculata]
MSSRLVTAERLSSLFFVFRAPDWRVVPLFFSCLSVLMTPGRQSQIARCDCLTKSCLLFRFFSFPHDDSFFLTAYGHGVMSCKFPLDKRLCMVKLEGGGLG